jgi:NADPH:quinone reductase-like Zn-dependent oxidoreductase
MLTTVNLIEAEAKLALQFAKAAGARVISTTSSMEKTSMLEKMGADHVINYNLTPNWGEEVKKITGGRGVDHVLEVCGPRTMSQSLQSVRIGGVVTIIGVVSGHAESQPTLIDTLHHLCSVRPIIVGSRQQFEDMNKAIEANDIHPVIDKQTFTLEEAQEAFKYLGEQKHFGKLTIKTD